MAHTYGISEVVGTSTTSIEEAITSAVARASTTVRGLDWCEVTEGRRPHEDGAGAHSRKLLSEDAEEVLTDDIEMGKQKQGLGGSPKGFASSGTVLGVGGGAVVAIVGIVVRRRLDPSGPPRRSIIRP